MNCVPSALVEPAAPSPDPGDCRSEADRREAGRRPASALELTLRALAPWLADPAITELCINSPGELFVEGAAGWHRAVAPWATFDWCRRLAKLVAHATRQRVDEESPLLSASLPAGERIQVVLPPATLPGRVAIAIRKPAARVWSVAELAGRGIFAGASRARDARGAAEQALQGLLKHADYEGFMRRAVAERCNIVVSGPTGSGKTTWTRALIGEIPASERLISIEDTAELTLAGHANHVRLLYSKDDQGLARVTPRQLLEASLRLRPDRILLAELRSDEAFDYLRNVNSGHPGSITSVHAGSAALAFEQLTLLVKQSRAGSELSREDIKQLLYLTVDVVIQFGFDGHERRIREVWYEPDRKRGLSS